tara:strand:- start:17731 stop:17928 length:198 start_codon:yes stop_codon:yes gene_type:complete
METWCYVLCSSLFGSITLTIKTFLKEKEKLKRIKYLEKMDNYKIKAIGNYEKNSKNEYLKVFENK